MPGLAAGLVSQWLNTLNGTSFTPPAALWGQLHTGDPGPAGTANPSALATRELITESVSSAGSPLALSNSPLWTMTAAEVISYLSVWSAATGGTFLFSGIAAVAQGVNVGDSVVLDSLDFSLIPQAG